MMTKEEIVKEIGIITKSIKVVEDSIDDFDVKEFLKLERCQLIYLNDEIKALSAPTCKDKLEKIKAEIEQMSDSKCEGTSVTIYSWGYMQEKILEIIDKYSGKENE